MKVFKFFAITLAFTAVTAIATAQTKEITSKAEVIAVSQIGDVTDMDFGKLYSLATGYSVTLEMDGAIDKRTSSTLDVPTVSDATIQLATVNIQGEASSTYTIGVPVAAVTLTDIANSANTMSLTDIEIYDMTGNVINIANPRAIGLTSKDKFKVGGTLTLGDAQPVGVYEGTFDITITFE